MANRRQTAANVEVDCSFPGGNIVVDSIANNEIRVHQDLRDTNHEWFYWYFRVRGAAGRRITFELTGSDAIGARGPAVSIDQGKTWRWVGGSAVDANRFEFAGPSDVHELRFSFGVPYVTSDLDVFLSVLGNNDHLVRNVLCVTKKRRQVELLRLGCVDHLPRYRVLLCCRHHACEAVASYAFEGLIRSFLMKDEFGAWLCENVEVLAVPFVDKDGVEDGDQGKYRWPHDHVQDYSGTSIYEATAELRRLVPQWSDGLLRAAIDLHCPHMRGQYNESIHFVGNHDTASWDRLNRFAGMLEETKVGPLPFSSHNNLPFGVRWNNPDHRPKGTWFDDWANGMSDSMLSSMIEIPYASADGVEVNKESATAFGVDMGRTLAAYLRDLREG